MRHAAIRALDNDDAARNVVLERVAGVLPFQGAVCELLQRIRRLERFAVVPHGAGDSRGRRGALRVEVSTCRRAQSADSRCASA